MDSNGRTKWLLWIAGVLVTIVLTYNTYLGVTVVNNANIRVAEDTRIAIQAQVAREKIQDKVDRQYSDIIQRLARIEAKMEK